MTETESGDQGSGLGDRKGRTTASRPSSFESADAALDELLASLVTPPTPVDLRASVLRRIEEAEKRSLVPWPWNRRWATLAAATIVVLLVAAVVLRRGPGPEPAMEVARSTERAPSAGAPRGGSLDSARTRNEIAAEPSGAAHVERPARTTSKRRAATQAAAVDVAEALPPLEAPAPLEVPEMTTDVLTTDALEVERLQVPPPIEIRPLDVDRGRNPQR